VKLTIVCVPLGGMAGGLMASRTLPAFGWRALYGIGGILPLALAILLWAAIPESPRFLAQRSGRWPELQKLLNRMQCAVPSNSAFRDSREWSGGRSSLRALFGPSLVRDTAGLWIAFLFCLGSIYLVFGWLPAMLSSQGADVAFASEGLAVYNFGGVVGVLIWAALITARGSRVPLLGAALACAATAVLIGLAPVHSGGMFLLAAIGLNGLLANALQTSLYAVAAHIYPTAMRASGIAWAAAIGRAEGILSSVFGAGLIASGAAAYWITIAASMALAFAGLVSIGNHIPRHREHKTAQRSF
jgi:AAHS family 4-hydroxybenzoate transporter-like MFS transporter